MSKSYRFKCRNNRCGSEFHRHFGKEEFEKTQYSVNGWACFNCGYPKMVAMGSRLSVKDGFQPGYQRNIGKHCATYSEYKAHLKNMGLIEIGYEDLDFNQEDKNINYWDEDLVKKIVKQYGVDLSGREIDGLLNGEIDKMG